MHSLSTILARRATAAAVAVGAVAAVLGGTMLLSAAGGAAATGSTDPSLDARSFQAVLEDPSLVGGSADPSADPTAAPDPQARRQLREDLRAARQLSGSDRKEALRAVGEKARSGAYGPAAEQRSTHRADRRSAMREAVTALLPDELQADLAALRDAPEDQRAELRSQILARALDGGYGEKVQRAAEVMQRFRSGTVGG